MNPKIPVSPSASMSASPGYTSQRSAHVAEQDQASAAGQAAPTPIRSEYLPILLTMFRDQQTLIATGLPDRDLRGNTVAVTEADDCCRVYGRDEVFDAAIRACNSHAALVDIAEEADTLSQNMAELLREYAPDDKWAKDLLKQVRALGQNARTALSAAQP
jgi:hypothetical protein